MTALATGVPSPISILAPLQLDQLRQVLIQYLQAQQDPVTNWIDGGRRRTQMEYFARAANDLLGSFAPTAAGSSFLDLALQLPSEADPDGWVDLIAAQIFSLTRAPAVLTEQVETFVSDGSSGPFTIDANTIVYNPLTKNRYYAVTTGTLVAGSPSTVLATVRAEAPNNPLGGVLYGDGPNSITALATPWAGVTVSNVPPNFSGVTTSPSPALGLGVVTVSGTPPALATAYDFEIVDDGQNTTAFFQWRQNGGPWSAPVAMAATFAIPATSVTVHFTDDAGGANPSFRSGDVYSLTAPGSPITTPGIPAETSAALAMRCYDRLPDITAIPTEDKRAAWAKAASAAVKRVKVAKDSVYPGRIRVTIAGAAGTSPLSGGVVAAVQAAIDQQESAGRLDLVQAATVTTVTATNGAFGIVAAPAAKLAQIKAAANLAFAAYVNSTDIGGVVRVAKVTEILVDAGAIKIVGLLLNGGGNVVLGSTAVAVAVDLGSLSWVAV